jgi:hypothetical protein
MTTAKKSDVACYTPTAHEGRDGSRLIALATNPPRLRYPSREGETVDLLVVGELERFNFSFSFNLKRVSPQDPLSGGAGVGY